MRKKCITALILLAKIFEVLLFGYDDSSKRTDFGKHLQSTKKSRTTIIIIRSSFKEQKFCKDCLKSMVGQITSFNVSSFVSKFKFLTNKVVPSSFSESPSSSSSLSATACSSFCHKTKKLLITASLYHDTKHRLLFKTMCPTATKDFKKSFQEQEYKDQEKMTDRVFLNVFVSVCFFRTFLFRFTRKYFKWSPLQV